MKLFCSNYWQNPQIFAAVHYFQKQPLKVFCKRRCSEKICKFHRKTPVLKSDFNKKLQHMCFPVKFVKLLRIPILKNICERLVLYFHYNSLHDFHYHHFHYHCETHLYRLRILLTIPLDCNMIPCLFQLSFVFFLRLIFFSSLIPSFPFFMPCKRTQNSF